MTSSIARMNCFLHGIEDFRIERGDTLSEPKFVQGDRLMQFDVVLANPPYSIKQWDRAAFASDPWGRNIFGTPPQGRADYAFQQHILKSLNPKTGRCAVLWPHGILFRNEEEEIRRKLIESDFIEAIIGLGPNLFYNSSMQSCIVVCRAAKPKEHREKVLFIDAADEVARERAQSFLLSDHIGRITSSYQAFKDQPGFATVATLNEIEKNHWSLNIPLYVQSKATKTLTQSNDSGMTPEVIAGWLNSSANVRKNLDALCSGAQSRRTNLNLLPTKNCLPTVMDHSVWQKVRLGDVCEEISVRVDNPAISGRERFVGLEHFDPGELKVRRWGTTKTLASSMKAFSAGDILFARRNAYLKRASQVDFDGLCSGDAIVLREKQDRVVSGFLAFVLNTNRFWEFAIANAAGTMSRRVNVKTLLSYEFDLPPLDQQRRIAEILWAADKVGEKAYIARKEILALRKAAHRELFLHGLNSSGPKANREELPHGWRMSTIGKSALIENRLRKPINSAERATMKGQYPYFGPTGILDYINEYRVEGEYTLIGEDGDHFLKFDIWDMTHLVRGRFNVNNHAHLLRGTEDCLTEWIFQYFKHRDITPFLSRQGSGRLKLQKAVLEMIPIVIPPLKEQEAIIEFLRIIDAVLVTYSAHWDAAKSMLDSFINELMG